VFYLFLGVVIVSAEVQYVMDSMIKKQSYEVNENYEPIKDAKKKKDDEIIDKPAKGCRADMPTLSVYDVKIDTNAKWLDFKKKNKLFILGISDKQCLTCCQDEPLLAFIKNAMHNKTYSYNGKRVPIARIDSSKKLSFM
jgi:hypothetical protein